MARASSVGTKHLVTPLWNHVLWQVVRSVTTVAKLTVRWEGVGGYRFAKAGWELQRRVGNCKGRLKLGVLRCVRL